MQYTERKNLSRGGITLKKVLVLSYFYPPLGGAGPLRMASFTTYLPEYGWNPYVISAANPDKSRTREAEAVPKNVNIYYTESILPVKWAKDWMENARLKSIYSVGWIIPTLLKAIKIIKKEDIDLIFVSSLPWTSSVVGIILKIVTRKPLLLEFRDAWSFNPSIRSSSIRALLSVVIEKLCFENL